MRAPCVVAGLAAGALAGLGDGLAAYLRTPAAGRDVVSLPWLVLHGAALLAAAGLAAGLAAEVVVRAAARRPALVALARALAAGPRAWFAPDPPRALGAALAALAVVPAFPLFFQLAARFVRAFHEPLLATLAVVLAAPAALALTAAAALLAAPAVERALRRHPRAASLGAVAAATVAAALALVARFVAREWHVLHRLDWTLPLAALPVAALALALAARGVARGARVAPAALAALAAATALALAVSGRALGDRQAVLSALLLRSVATRHVVPALQRLGDRDGDGHGTLFGGDDCDDRDPAVHPGATDLPGDGVDANCSGRDAPARDLPDGYVRPSAVAAPARAPSFVFVTIDSLRADHVGAYGHRRATTPSLDRLAARGARFTRAYTVAPQSLRSFAATFTGRAPATLAWSGADPRFPALAEENVTLAERLRAAGWATGAFTTTRYFDDTPGFFQGFDVAARGAYFKTDEAATVAAARAFIARHARDGRPFFAWVHLMTPHEPYVDRASPRDFGHDTLARYDEEVAFADAALGRVLDALDPVERAGTPVVVAVFGDHGEAFGEHGWRYHSHDVHEEVLRVPLVVRGPGIAPGAYDPLVALYDLFPTALALAGLPTEAPAPSRSLLPWLAAGPAARVPWRDALVADVVPGGAVRVASVALVTPRWKLIRDVARHAWELYDLAADPGEARNLHDAAPAIARQLRDRLGDHDAPARMYPPSPPSDGHRP